MAGFCHKDSDNVKYYTIEEFENTGKVKTCFSTRIGGISEGSYSYLNLGYKSGDLKSNIDENFKILCKAAKFNIQDLVLSNQVHSDKGKIVNFMDRGKGISKERDTCGVDALITNDKDVALCIFAADCVPVFLLDAVNDVIALCHAGWRGVVNSIVPKTINKMIENFSSKPQDILAAIGPSIGPCCFNVGYEVVDEFEKVFDDTGEIIIKDNEEYRINLWNAIRHQLVMNGVLKEKIIISGSCTSCCEEEFYSYRRDGAKTGRMVSIMQLI